MLMLAQHVRSTPTGAASSLTAQACESVNEVGRPAPLAAPTAATTLSHGGAARVRRHRVALRGGFLRRSLGSAGCRVALQGGRRVLDRGQDLLRGAGGPQRRVGIL